MRSIGLALAVSLLLFPISFSFAGESQDIRKITVSGKAENTLEAQRAEVNLSLKIVSKEMALSQAALMTKLSKLEKELQAIGLDAKNIKRSLVLQGEEYNWEHDSRVLKGYYAACSVDVSVNDIGKMAAVYRTLASYKDITIESTAFKRNDEFEVRKAEFEKALLAAKKKAEFMAQALGARVGKVHSIQEVGAENWFETKAYANVAAGGSAGGGQTAYGTVKITARVVVEFELK